MCEVFRLSTRMSLRNTVLLGMLFGLICFGLGYSTLNRYDPGKIEGTPDAADYTETVRIPLDIASYRPFVPALAKPFYWAVDGHSGSWDPVLFGMLASTSILTALTAVLIVAIGLEVGFAYSVSLLGALLFLLNFVVVNWSLAAYVDSGEALFLALTVWSLLKGRWYLLPLWAIPGSLSKETFAPFAVILAFVWWLNEKPRRPVNLLWVLALAVLSGSAVLLSFSNGGLFAGSFHYTVSMGHYAKVGYARAVLRCLTAHEFRYTFMWLLPLGIWRLRLIDRRWTWSVLCTVVFALLLGGYGDAMGNASRAFFNISGPLLSLSAAALLVNLGRPAGDKSKFRDQEEAALRRQVILQKSSIRE